MGHQHDDYESGYNQGQDDRDSEVNKLEAENARLKAELTKLKEWQQIVLGTGTDQEAVIRMAAAEYTQTAIQCWKERVEKLEAELVQVRARKDNAYLERNKVVAALAKCFPSGVARTAIDGWHEEWHGCVYIDLPTGQVSWHYHDSHAYLFADLPPYGKPWDGHDTEEKYRRVLALTSAQAKAREERLRKCLRKGLGPFVDDPGGYEAWYGEATVLVQEDV